MSASINLQAVVLRLRAAVIAARSQIDDHQLSSLMGILDSLLDVAYVANDHQLAVLLESLLDAVRDTTHGVPWKSEIPSVETVIMVAPSNTVSTAMTLQQAILHDFLTSAVMAWARSAYASDQVQVSFDAQLRATTYGVDTFAWAAEIRSTHLPNPVPVEIALDSDGYMSVNLLATQV